MKALYPEEGKNLYAKTCCIVYCRKSELLSDVRDYQCKLKDLKQQLEKAEAAELDAKGQAYDQKLALEAVENTLREKTSLSKSTINSLQLAINSLKTK